MPTRVGIPDAGWVCSCGLGRTVIVKVLPSRLLAVHVLFEGRGQGCLRNCADNHIYF
jgi:hypothetical protein